MALSGLRYSKSALLVFGAGLVIGLVVVAVQLPGFARVASLAMAAGIVALPFALVWQPVSMHDVMNGLPAILYAGIVSSGIAFTFQIVAQRHTPPAEAALIMSLESVFAAIAGAILLGEMLTIRAAIGAFLIMLGVVMVETGPLLLASASGFFTRKNRTPAAGALGD